MNTSKLKEFLTLVTYDEDGQIIWGINKTGEYQMIAQIRGWGAISNMFKTEKESENFQDDLGKFIAEAINNKLKTI